MYNRDHEIPLSLLNISRRSAHVKKKKSIELPKRTNLNTNANIIKFNRETLFLFMDLVVNVSEMMLESEISNEERLAIQLIQNQIFSFNDKIKDVVSEETVDRHEDRVDFLLEMMALCALIKPKKFNQTKKKFEKWIKEQYKL